MSRERGAYTRQKQAHVRTLFEAYEEERRRPTPGGIIHSVEKALRKNLERCPACGKAVARARLGDPTVCFSCLGSYMIDVHVMHDCSGAFCGEVGYACFDCYSETKHWPPVFCHDCHSARTHPPQSGPLALRPITW